MRVQIGTKSTWFGHMALLTLQKYPSILLYCICDILLFFPNPLSNDAMPAHLCYVGRLCGTFEDHVGTRETAEIAMRLVLAAESI
jgi:hypothetical protein